MPAAVARLGRFAVAALAAAVAELPVQRARNVLGLDQGPAGRDSGPELVVSDEFKSRRVVEC